MKPKEITCEILRDISRIDKSSTQRLLKEYDRERKKFKIDKTKSYPKVYEIKTAAKNTWLIFLRKSSTEKKYINIYSIASCCVVYFYDSIGLKVFRQSEAGMIEVFNGHFFSRYNERLNLNLQKPIEIVKMFFNNSGYFQYQLVNKKNESRAFGMCKEGIALGDYVEKDSWIINKTFVSNSMIRPNQIETKRNMITTINLEILAHLFTENQDENFLQKKNDLLKELMPA